MTWVDARRWFCVENRCPAVIGTTETFVIAKVPPARAERAGWAPAANGPTSAATASGR